MEVKVFRFEELEKRVQEKVIEKWYEEENFPFLGDDLRESLSSNEKNIFENDFKIWYSLSYCQGDGLNIEGSIDIKKILDLLPAELKEKFTGKIYSLNTKSNNSRYSFHSKSDIHYELDNLDVDDYDLLCEEFENEVLPVIWNIYDDLCRELQKDGYSIIEYRMSTEEFTDMCSANEYEFYIDGKMV